MKWDRVWIFFVIIAIGLALSWGRVGQNTREDMGEDDFLLLRTEPGCVLPRDTCAAYLSDVALVAKAEMLPDARIGLYFKAVGLAPGEVEGFAVELLHEPEPPVTLAVLQRASDWQAIYAGKPLDWASVRVSFRHEGIRHVADYRLEPPPAQ